MTRSLTLLATAIAVCALQAAPTDVQAGEVAANATDFCQGSMSNLENGLRKRPLALANEGAGTKFVSCSMQRPQTTGEEITLVGVLFTNRTNATLSVSCTLIDGIALPFPGMPPIYLPKTIDVEPMAYAIAAWDSELDNGDVPFRLANLSCALPSGMELNLVDVLSDPIAP